MRARMNRLLALLVAPAAVPLLSASVRFQYLLVLILIRIGEIVRATVLSQEP